jgi:amidase
VTAKESFNVAELPTTWGILQFKDFVPKEDAVAVSRTEGAGAIIFGKTNVPLMLRDWQSYDEIYGTTNNPWDLERTSDGSVAALAAGFGPWSLSLDIGGSLRIPAHFCGVDLLVVSPVTRSAADLALALDVIAGPGEERAGVGYRLQLRPPRDENLKGFGVLVIDEHPLVPTATAVRATLNRLSEQLVNAGVKISHENHSPNLTESTRAYMKLLMSSWVASWPPDLYSQMRSLAEVLEADDKSLTAERTRGAVMSHRDWIAIARPRLGQQWSVQFREFDVVLCPATPTPTFAHDHPPTLTLQEKFAQTVVSSSSTEARHIEIDGKACPHVDAELVWSWPATMAGLPATIAPIDRSQNGLPIGVQIIRLYLEDRTTIEFAEYIEREFGGFVPPPA